MIDKFFIAFWTLMVFASVAWYAFLIFYLGIKGGIEIKRMTRALTERHEQAGPLRKPEE